MEAKQRMVEVTNLAECRLLLAAAPDDLGMPVVYRSSEGRVFTDTEELRRWRSQHTSDGDPNVHG